MSCAQIKERFSAQMLGWGFSLRLSLYFAIVFTVGALGLLIIGYFFMARAFEDREIEMLDERLREYHAWLEQYGRPTLESRFNAQVANSQDEMFLRLRVDGQEVVFHSPQCEMLMDPSRLQSLPPITRHVGLDLGGHDPTHRWAVATLPLENGHFLQAGKSLVSGEQTLDRFRQMFLLGVLPALFVGVIGGTIMTYRAVRPIRSLITTIDDILQTGDLSRRADPPKGHDELNPLVAAFNRLLGRHERLIDSMHTSLDSVAHDLRTPMARLRTTAETALQKGGDETSKTEALSDCLEESDHVLSMLRTLMELSEAEAGAMRLQLEEFGIDEILKQVIELYEFVAEDKNITLALEPIQNDVTVSADRARLLQLFANLVDNAIKFSPNETTVTVGAHASGDHVIAWVQDRGPGIAQGDRGRIWDRLYRADRSRSTRGVGLGLSFVKAIAEAHGGKAEVKCETGSGARFMVTLPLQPPEVPGSASSSVA